MVYGQTITRRQLLKRSLWSAVACAGLGSLSASLGCQKRGRRLIPTIVLITLDTTRADHLGCYGYHRPTSPNLDQFAEQALVYDRAYAPGTWTFPSHASLFTGQFATSHGARNDPQGTLRLTDVVTGPPRRERYRVQTIHPQQDTLASILKAAGYATGAVVAGPWMKRVFRLNRGFDSYDDDNITADRTRLAAQVTDRALAWMDRTADQRQFLFLNYFDPHPPYWSQNPYLPQFLPGPRPVPGQATTTENQLIDTYDAEVRYMDEHVGRLLDALKQRKLFDDAWIIITADHGELFGEHKQFGHGDTPYQPVVRIPMMIKEPGVAGRGGRSGQYVQLVDILPTILGHLDIGLPVNVQGNILPHVQHPILIESRTLPQYAEHGNWLAIIDGDMKFVWNSQGNHMLFDLKADPTEVRNLAGSDPVEVSELAGAMHQYLAALPRPVLVSSQQQIDKATLDALRGVGYLK